MLSENGFSVSDCFKEYRLAPSCFLSDTQGGMASDRGPLQVDMGGLQRNLRKHAVCERIERRTGASCLPVRMKSSREWRRSWKRLKRFMIFWVTTVKMTLVRALFSDQGGVPCHAIMKSNFPVSEQKLIRNLKRGSVGFCTWSFLIRVGDFIRSKKWSRFFVVSWQDIAKRKEDELNCLREESEQIRCKMNELKAKGNSLPFSLSFLFVLFFSPFFKIMFPVLCCRWRRV